MKRKKDLFTSLLNIRDKKTYLKVSFQQYRKIIKYLLFGFLTTLINLLIYTLCLQMDMHYLTGNVLAFVVSVVFAYLTNKNWVFIKGNPGIINIKEFMRFISSRSLTLLMESFSLYFFISMLGFDQYFVKVVVNLGVIAANYLLSEFVVFKYEKTTEEV